MKPTFPVCNKHVLTGGNRALTVENVNSCTVNDHLCMFNISDLGLPCKQFMLNVCPCQYSSPPTDKAVGIGITLILYQVTKFWTSLN